MLNKESNALDEYYSNAPKHWINLIKRNHLNPDSFIKNVIRKHLKPGKGIIKNNSNENLKNTQQKIITANVFAAKKNKAVTKNLFRNKMIFSKLAVIPEQKVKKLKEHHKNKEKIHFSGRLNTGESIQENNKVRKVKRMRPILRDSELSIMSIKSEVDNSDSSDKSQIKDTSQFTIKSNIKKTVGYKKNIINKKSDITQTINVDNNNHSVSYGDNYRSESSPSGFFYKEERPKQIKIDHFIKEKFEQLPEQKTGWLFDEAKTIFLQRDECFAIDETQKDYWQELPDDVWSNIYLDDIYMLKEIPGNNDVRGVLWNG
ncbi:MAG: hypothetical protein OQL19_01550 [Gammaproteobacteria bacterium]|nr:hypothetical protein [Gammaproteobacteria bacterium]